MGWRPDVAEIARLHPDLGEAAPGPSADLVAQMGFFWQACHDMALADVDRAGLPADALVVVAHEEVAASGDAGVRRLFAACGLRWSDHVARHVQSWSRGEVASAETGGPLHVLDRSPQDVGSAWRANVSSVELSRLEEATSKARAALDLRRLRLSDA
jgi:isopentenyl diphosphate isomerase/L-lactate dehydrogenase-like FMN-dependent dehydrogenase